ncbi:MAG: hypothetical protein KIT11_05390 [Fimbriimonadaceae bacterium]|nr:hypothetical protein [Fimbriimonadaceae bacterium]QYK56674.1 MAG: hypothetical protein KF733_04130 [Fimbriimonadaceae bacterium]
MQGRVAELEVVLRAALDSFDRDIDAAKKKAVEGGGAVAKKFSDEFVKGMKAAGTAVSVAIGAPLAAAAVKAVNAARDLGEAQNATNETFKRAAGVVQEFAETSASAYGVSKRAANEYAASLGAIYKASGLTEKASADLSVTTVKLAADLASFKNLSVEDALNKIRSGLVGEIEPLRSVGVLLSDQTLQRRALTEGITEQFSKLDEGTKVQLRFKEILEQTKDAQGDYARTSGDLANQQRTLAAETEDVAAALGETLLPVAKDFVSVVRQAVGWLKGLDSEQRQWIVRAGAVAIALGPLMVAVGNLAAAWNAVAAAAARAQAAQASAAAAGGAGASGGALGGLLGRAVPFIGGMMLGNMAADALANFADPDPQATSDRDLKKLIAQYQASGRWGELDARMKSVLSPARYRQFLEFSRLGPQAPPRASQGSGGGGASQGSGGGGASQGSGAGGLSGKVGGGGASRGSGGFAPLDPFAVDETLSGRIEADRSAWEDQFSRVVRLAVDKALLTAETEVQRVKVLQSFREGAPGYEQALNASLGKTPAQLSGMADRTELWLAGQRDRARSADEQARADEQDREAMVKRVMQDMMSQIGQGDADRDLEARGKLAAGSSAARKANDRFRAWLSDAMAAGERYGAAMAEIQRRTAMAGDEASRTRQRTLELADSFGVGTTSAERIANGMEKAERVMAETLKVEKVERFRVELERMAATVEDRFMGMFDDLLRNGFNGFFSNVLNGFRQLLADMAREWIVSQVRSAVGGLIGRVIGGAFGGGGGGKSGVSVGDLWSGGDGFARAQRVLRPGGSALGGQESAMAGGASVTSSTSYGGEVNVAVHVSTPDAQSFLRSQGQIAEAMGRATMRAMRRNG